MFSVEMPAHKKWTEEMKEKLLSAVDQSIDPKTLAISWNKVSQIMNLEKNVCKVQYQNVYVPQFKKFTLREYLYIGALINYYNNDLKLIYDKYLQEIHYSQKGHEKMRGIYQKQTKIKLTKEELEETKKIYQFFKTTFLDDSNLVSNGPFDLYVKSFGESVSIIELRFLVKIKKFLSDKKEAVQEIEQYFKYCLDEQ